MVAYMPFLLLTELIGGFSGDETLPLSVVSTGVHVAVFTAMFFASRRAWYWVLCAFIIVFSGAAINYWAVAVMSC